MTRFYEIGCRECGKGGDWKIFTDGYGNFEAEHPCGHKSFFEIVKVVDPKPTDMRLIA